MLDQNIHWYTTQLHIFHKKWRQPSLLRLIVFHSVLVLSCVQLVNKNKTESSKEASSQQLAAAQEIQLQKISTISQPTTPTPTPSHHIQKTPSLKCQSPKNNDK